MLTKSKTLGVRQQRIYDFLRANPVAVLSTVDPDGDPHGVVVCFAVSDNFVVRILTKKGTRKYDNIVHHNHVALTVFEPHTQTTAQIHGVATERGSSRDVTGVAGAIFGASSRTSNSGLPPIVKLQAGAFTTLQIEPVQIRMAKYAGPDSGDYAGLFESIESFDFTAEP